MPPAQRMPSSPRSGDSELVLDSVTVVLQALILGTSWDFLCLSGTTLFCWCCHNKLPQTGWVQTMDVILSPSGASSPISRCWQGGSSEFPGTMSRLLDGGDSSDKPWCALVVADHPSLCPCSHGRLPVSLLSASYKDIRQWVQGLPHSVQPHHHSSLSAKTRFQISHILRFWVWREVERLHYHESSAFLKSTSL